MKTVKEIAIEESPFEHHSFGHETFVSAFEAGYEKAEEHFNPFTGCKCKLYESERSKMMEAKIKELEHANQQLEEIHLTSVRRIENLEKQLKEAQDCLKENYDMIRSTSYTVDPEGNRVMDGHEYVWIDRALTAMKRYLTDAGVLTSRRESSASDAAEKK